MTIGKLKAEYERRVRLGHVRDNPSEKLLVVPEVPTMTDAVMMMTLALVTVMMMPMMMRRTTPYTNNSTGIMNENDGVEVF